MKSIVYILFILLSFATIGSRAQITTFSRAYKGIGFDFGYAVVETSDKGFAIAGATSSISNGSTDAYLVKTDSAGNFLWRKLYGGINIDQAHAIRETKDSGLVMVGFTNSFGNGGYDIYLIRTDKNGDTLWTKTYGGTDWDFAYSIEVTADSGFVIAGGTYSYGAGAEDMYLIRTNSLGDTLWTHTYGGAKSDEARSIKKTKGGGFIFTGFTKSFGEPNGDFYTIKTNSNGDTTWTCIYGGPDEDVAYDVIESIRGRYVVGGKSTLGNNGGVDIFVTNVTLAGKVSNTLSYGGPDIDELYSLQESPGGRWAMGGYTNSYGKGGSDYVLYIENPFTGFKSATMGGSNTDIAYSMTKTHDGGYALCGTSNSFGNLDHIFLVKTDSNGVYDHTVIDTITGMIAFESNSNYFKIFPNPANDKLVIEISPGIVNVQSATQLIITDILGCVKYQTALQNKVAARLEIATDNLPEGIYIVQIQNNSYLINQKLIIKH